MEGMVKWPGGHILLEISRTSLSQSWPSILSDGRDYEARN